MSVFHRAELRYYMKHVTLKEIIRCILPLGIAMMLAKFLTYKSYGIIPVSLTHTVKALQPFFNVLIVFIWTGNSVDLPTFLTLIPIIVGVAYASSKEIEYFSSFPSHPKIRTLWIYICSSFYRYWRVARCVSQNANANGIAEELCRRRSSFMWVIGRFIYAMRPLVR